MEQQRHKLTEVTVALAQEVDGIIGPGTNQALGLFKRFSQYLFGDPLEAHRPHVEVLDIVIKQDVSEFPKQFELVVGGAGHGFAELL